MHLNSLNKRGLNYAREVFRTKRRDAEFAEKNAEKIEEMIKKKLSVRLCGLSDCFADR